MWFQRIEELVAAISTVATTMQAFGERVERLEKKNDESRSTTEQDFSVISDPAAMAAGTP